MNMPPDTRQRSALISTAVAGIVLFWQPGMALSATNSTATTYLSFDALPDGKCQILSDGGKLIVLRNAHKTRAIKYRLVRVFAGVPQSRMDGEIGPNSAPQKLGCNKVSGRTQEWTVERAKLSEQAP